MDYLNVGSVPVGSAPVDEPCVQVGSDYYVLKSKVECKKFKKQLERTFPIPAHLKGEVYFIIKSYPHDFGTYREVVIVFNEGNPSAVQFALDVEGNIPLKWDEKVKEELNQELEQLKGE